MMTYVEELHADCLTKGWRYNVNLCRCITCWTAMAFRRGNTHRPMQFGLTHTYGCMLGRWSCIHSCFL